MAAIHGLFHVAIKTSNLEATVQFYETILGLVQVKRPDFGFPGAWLSCSGLSNAIIIHVYAGGPSMGPNGSVSIGSGAIDHVSLACTGYHELRDRIVHAGLDWREYIVPGTSLWQLFVYDPSGIMLELTFDGNAEGGAQPDMANGRRYIAGESFFK